MFYIYFPSTFVKQKCTSVKSLGEDIVGDIEYKLDGQPNKWC